MFIVYLIIAIIAIIITNCNVVNVIDALSSHCIINSTVTDKGFFGRQRNRTNCHRQIRVREGTVHIIIPQTRELLGINTICQTD